MMRPAFFRSTSESNLIPSSTTRAPTTRSTSRPRTPTRTKTKKKPIQRRISQMDDIELELHQEKEKQLDKEKQQQQQQQQRGRRMMTAASKERVARSLSPKRNTGMTTSTGMNSPTSSRPPLLKKAKSQRSLTYLMGSDDDDSEDSEDDCDEEGSILDKEGEEGTNNRDNNSYEDMPVEENRRESSRSIGSSLHPLASGRISGSNRKLVTARNQLDTIFGEPTWLQETSSFTWEKYFREEEQDSNNNNNNTDPKERIMTSELERAIRTKNIKKLRHLWKDCGVSMESRNNLGETVAHLLCREQHCLEVLMFLIKDAKVSLRVRDSATQKTILHELAFWNGPNFDPQIFGAILKEAPELLWAQDNRRFLPMDYVPKHTQEDWYNYLLLHKSTIQLTLIRARCQEDLQQFNAITEQLQRIIEVHNKSKNRAMAALTAAVVSSSSGAMIEEARHA